MAMENMIGRPVGAHRETKREKAGILEKYRHSFGRDDENPHHRVRINGDPRASERKEHTSLSVSLPHPPCFEHSSRQQYTIHSNQRSQQ